MRILTLELSEQMEISEIMKIFEDAIAIAEEGIVCANPSS